MWLLNSLVPASFHPNLALPGESEQAWSESLEEGLAESLDFTLWSAQRPLKDLEQIRFGDDCHGSGGELGEERGQRAKGAQETGRAD